MFPVFTASFGPGGFRTTRMGGMGGARARQAQEQPQTTRSMLLQLAPLLFLIFISFLGSIPNLFSSSPARNPSYSFAPQTPYTSARYTAALDIPYYVSNAEFHSHPIWSSIPEKYQNEPKAGQYSRDLLSFERTIEKHGTMGLCEWEEDDRKSLAYVAV